MLVHEVMTSPAITVTYAVTVKHAIELLAEHSITSLPVVDDDGLLVGVVSEADVIRDMLLPDPRASAAAVRLTSPPFPARVADVMSSNVLTVTRDTDLALAGDLLTSTAVKSLPVVEGQRLVGVLSRRDIILMLARQDSRIEADVEAQIRGAGHDWRVAVEDGIVIIEGPGDEERRDAEALVCTVPGVIGISFAGQKV